MNPQLLLEVYRLNGLGYTRKQIADSVGLAESTTHNYIRALRKLYGVTNDVLLALHYHGIKPYGK